MTKKTITCILMLIVLGAMVSLSGCTVPSQKASDTLTGKDVFNPSRFGMATYAMAVEGGSSSGLLQVIASTGEDEGDRLTSIVVTPNGSRRMDAWLNRSREGVNRAVMTVIDQGGIQSTEVPEAYDMTTMDGTWNSPDAVYKYYGEETVSVPAGTYANCSVYYGTKRIQFQDGALELTIFYYLHPSAKVPVMYVVRSDAGSIAYALESVYGPNDVDSAPERAIQSYFERLGSGEFKKAAGLLVTESLDPPGRDAVLGMEANMTRTYGAAGDNMAIQYVITGLPRSTGTIEGHGTVMVEWSSVHYSAGQVYAIDGTFRLVNKNGWKIIV